MDWWYFYQEEPWGEWRADLRQGHTTAIIANILRRKGSRAYNWKDFEYRSDAGHMENMIGKMKAIAGFFRGRARKGKQKGNQ